MTYRDVYKMVKRANVRQKDWFDRAALFILRRLPFTSELSKGRMFAGGITGRYAYPSPGKLVTHGLFSNPVLTIRRNTIGRRIQNSRYPGIQQRDLRWTHGM